MLNLQRIKRRLESHIIEALKRTSQDLCARQRYYACPALQPYYYGTPGGAEIDLVLEFPGWAKWAIEIKRNSTPSLSKGFYSGCEDIKPDKRFVVYSGMENFPMGEGITASSLPNLMQELLKQ